KLFPCCLSASLRCWFDAVLLEDVCNRFVCQHVTEIREGSLNSSVTPATIFLSHAYDEGGNILHCSRPARCSACTAIVLPGNQSSMPGQESFWSNDCCDLRQ